ncbi:C40 family peptidase [Frigidibacter sp. ROC022]|uniref:C40 family peptidase n=1 Tax=Frigidibacter sp. ROC022 TaxID=2971796 RepID=UPI00215A1F16|nr:C40 family peptidase [Frigidibacter sp. ROC022]MCR8724226.1 C40 family peptidase [Frigidibacter sp. ROC022]
MDRRITPFSGRVAASHLRGQVAAELYIDPEPHQARGNPFLLDRPEGARDRQLLSGDALDLYERRDGWAYVRAAKDGYCGWLPETALAPPGPVTHRVAVRTTWAYPAPSSRQAALFDLHFGARVQQLAAEDGWSEISCAGLRGFVPSGHLKPADSVETDPVAVARLFLGTPYVWAGNSGFGIDCSGLVQAALLACGIACPGDSDLQEAALGRALEKDAALRPGDLMFWKGHVALVADPGTLIHAYGHAMLVGYEPIATAVPRILAQGEPVSSCRRL